MSNHIPATAEVAATTEIAVVPSNGRKAAAAKKPAKPKAKPKAKVAAKAKAKPAPADTTMPPARATEQLCVFALRMTLEERDEIHAAAGPARASRFVRAVALAAARGDAKALQAILFEVQGAATR